MKMIRTVSGVLAILLTAGLALAQGAPPQERGQVPSAREQTPRVPAPEEMSVVTHHKVRIGGQDIAYTATAAMYIVRGTGKDRADDGAPKATVFFVYYSKDNVPDTAARPISFVYNGGPGSGSMFTHMGLGPKRILLDDFGQASAAPYSVVDNGDSFFDATDLVFIDAVGTGYSRPWEGEDRTQFYGIVQDATVFSDFIYQFLTRNERWASPKFLIGESYGTTRSAQLSRVLQQRHGIFLNGVVLVSSVAFANWGADDRSIFFLPSYIATAWYHKLLPSDLQSLSIEEIVQRARQFAHGEYAAALEKGDEIPSAEYQEVVKNLARLTGLKPKYIEQTNLRISPQRWFKELLRDRRLTVGRLDSRFVGMDRDAAGETDEYDPSQPAYYGAYAAGFQDYVRRTLKWTTERYYYISGNVRPWDQTGNTEVAEALRAAMTQEGNLKLLVVQGYYDFATPFNGIEMTVSHMMLEPSIRKNVSFTYYEAGHMMYIEKKAREKLHKDVVDFINASYKR